MKIAAIDIGSNAIRFVLAEDEQILRKIRIPLRLGAEAFGPLRRFSNETIDLSVEVFKSMAQILKDEKVTKYKAIATSAFRDSENSKLFSDRILKETGLIIEEVSGELEAQMILNSILKTMDLESKKDYLLFDLGGGSLELSKVEEGVIIGSKSFDLGTVRLLNLMKSEENEKNYLNQIKKEIRSFLDENIYNSKQLNIIGTGGNFRRVLKLRNEAENKVKDYFTFEEVTALKKEMKGLTFLERIKEYELRPDRADIIIPGLEIIEMVASLVPVKKIYAPRVGLINGILSQMVDK